MSVLMNLNFCGFVVNMASKLRRELAVCRRKLTSVTEKQVDVWLRDSYPFGAETGAAGVWSLALSEAGKYGIDPSVASAMAEEYEKGSDIFGKPSEPSRFVDAYMLRLSCLSRIAETERALGQDTQDSARERRLKRTIEAYAARAAAGYGLDPSEAASKAGRYLTEVLLPGSRSFQDRVIQIPSNSP